jgi:flagellar protein FliS
MDARSSYREAAVLGASPLALVICLYEQIIEDLRRALAAQARGSIEGRTRSINHAVLVLAHLQSSLDKDQGGKVAVNLERFYNQVRIGLVGAQLQQSAAAIETQISHLMLVHDAWCEVERRIAAPAIASGSAPLREEPDHSSQSRASSDWSA